MLTNKKTECNVLIRSSFAVNCALENIKGNISKNSEL